MLNLREEASLAQMHVGRDIYPGLDGQGEVGVALRPLDQRIALLGRAEAFDDLLHFLLMRNPERRVRPRFVQQLVVAGHLGVPLGEVLPGPIGRRLQVGHPEPVGCLIGRAGSVDKHDLAALELPRSERSGSSAHNRIPQSAGPRALGDHPVPDVQVWISGLDNRRDHSLLQRNRR